MKERHDLGWDRPNRKAADRLDFRVRWYKRTMARSDHPAFEEFHQPGSQNRSK